MSVLLSLFAAMLTASAQDTGTESPVPPALSADALRVSPDARDTLSLDDARRSPAFAARAHVQYIDQPLVWFDEDDQSIALIDRVVGAQLTGSGAWGPARLGLVMPVYMLSTSEVNGSRGSALGDMRAQLKVTVLDPDRAGARWGVALVGGGTLPLGGDALQLGHGTPTWELGAVGQLAATQRVTVLANLGTRGLPQVVLAEGSADDALAWGLGTALALTPRLTGTVEVVAQAPWDGLNGNREASQLEALLGARRRTDAGRIVGGAVGAGLTDGVGSPRFRVALGIGQDAVGPTP